MAITQETIVLNSFGFAERRRTTSNGTKSRFTVSIKADAIPHVFDAQALGRGPAEAIAEAIRKQIRDIGEFATLGTQRARAAAAKALAAGKEWAVDRYSGGKMGTMPPDQTKRLFNDSGRLSAGIYAQAVGDEEWVVNVPANRFDPSTFDPGPAVTGRFKFQRDEAKAAHKNATAKYGHSDSAIASMTAMVERLQELVPALRNGEGLASVPEVAKAVQASVGQIIQRTENVSSQKATAMARAALGLARQLAAGLDLV